MFEYIVYLLVILLIGLFVAYRLVTEGKGQSRCSGDCCQGRDCDCKRMEKRSINEGIIRGQVKGGIQKGNTKPSAAPPAPTPKKK